MRDFSLNQISLKDIFEWPTPLKNLLIGLFCLIILYLGYLFDVSSLNTQLANEKQVAVQVQEQIQSTLIKSKKMANKVAHLQEWITLYEKWQKQLIPEKEVSTLINQILKISTMDQLQFSKFEPGQPIQENEYFKVPIKLTASGSYYQLADFISQVVNLSWIVAVRDVSFTNASLLLQKKADQKQIINDTLYADINFEIYYLADQNVKK